MSGPKIKKPAVQKFVDLAELPPDGKGFVELHHDCMANRSGESEEIINRAGGHFAPKAILHLNERLARAFQCEDHYVAIEKQNGLYQYVHRYRKGLFSLGPTPLAPFDPKKIPIIANGLVILQITPTSNQNSLEAIAIPTHRYEPFINREAIIAMLSRPLLYTIANGALVKDIEAGTPVSQVMSRTYEHMTQKDEK